MTQDISSPTEPLNNEYTAEDIQVLGGREAASMPSLPGTWAT